MFFRSTATLKHVTLSSAGFIFTVLVGLALSNVLILGKDAPINRGYAEGEIPEYAIAIIVSYCVLAVLFVHKVALMQGIENERLAKGMIPAPWRLTSLATMIVIAGIAVVLMSQYAVQLNAGLYLITQAVLALAYLTGLAVGSNVRRPWKLWRRYRYLAVDYTAHMAHTWLLFGIALFVAAAIELVAFATHAIHMGNAQYLACVTVLSAMIVSVDFAINFRNYFGGSWLAAGSRLVYIRLPLSGPQQDGRGAYAPAGGSWEMAVERALVQCDFASLARRRRRPDAGRQHSRRIVPFSPLAFYAFFLDLKQEAQRYHAIQCSGKFFDAFHEVHFYDGKPEAEGSMVFELARIRGLDIYIAGAAESARADRHMISGDSFLKVDRAVLRAEIAEYHKRVRWLRQWHAAKLDEPIKRVFVCSPLFGVVPEPDPEKQRVTCAANTRRTLWYCYQLMVSWKESVAPIAPHAFYPLFLPQEKPYGDEWQRLCQVVLRSCDAVYIYTTDGLPSLGELSAGMRSVYDKAVRMGVEIHFRRAAVPPADWLPCLSVDTHSNGGAPYIEMNN